MEAFNFAKGMNYLADYIGMSDVLSFMFDNFSKSIPVFLLSYMAGYPIKKLSNYWTIRKSYEELLNRRVDEVSHFFSPKFLGGYSFSYGFAKKGGLGYFDQMGSLTNFSGTFYDIFTYPFDVVPYATKKFLKTLIPIDIDIKKFPHVNNFICIINQWWKSQELEATSKVSKLFQLTSKQKKLSNRKKREICTGGWVVSPAFRKPLADSPITYMLTRDSTIEIDGKEMEIKKEESLNEELVENIAKSGKSLPWGIAKQKNGKFICWLVKPHQYDIPATLVMKNGKRIGEENRAFDRAGMIWMFDLKKGKMFSGGDKAPASAVAAPINPQFIDLLCKKKDNKTEFKNKVGKESEKFVAALEIIFKNRKGNIGWEERYDYPLYIPQQYQKELLSQYIGIHRLDHVIDITVKDVVPL